MTASPSAPGIPPAPGGASDPSMEDILASIRRILSEDEAEAHTPAPLPAEAGNSESGSDVLTLDASMLVAEPTAREPARYVEPEPPAPPALQPMPAAVVQPPAPEPVPVSEPPRAMPEPLLGPQAAAAASSAVGSLLRTLVSERQQIAVHRGGPTIEDLVREEVRPLLKEWLDSNLPPLVERLVRAEIERLVGQSLT